MSDFTRKVRIHFLGGLRGSWYESDRLKIWPAGDDQGLEITGVPPDSNALDTFKGAGVYFIGVEEILFESGIDLHIWHPFYEGALTYENYETIGEVFRSIAFTLKDTAPDLAQTARHIAFCTSASESLIRQLSEQYYRQLGYAHKTSTNPGQKFGNLETVTIFLTIHSILMHFDTTFDFLAYFVSQTFYNPG